MVKVMGHTNRPNIGGFPPSTCFRQVDQVFLLVTFINRTKALFRTIYSPSVKCVCCHFKSTPEAALGVNLGHPALQMLNIEMTDRKEETSRANPQRQKRQPSGSESSYLDRRSLTYSHKPTMNGTKVAFSLSKPKASTPSSSAQAPSLKQPAAFASLDDDEPIDAAPTASGSKASSSLNANKALAAQAAPKMSKAQKRRAEAAKLVDDTVYEYDEVWDRMQAEKERQKALKNAEAQERKVRYLCLRCPSLHLTSYCKYFVFSRST